MQVWHYVGQTLKHIGRTKKCKSGHEETVFYMSLLQDQVENYCAPDWFFVFLFLFFFFSQSKCQKA